MISPDKRGKTKTSRFKNKELVVTHIKQFLSKFPKYKSHYSPSEKIYFHPNLTLKEIYEIYLSDDNIPKEYKAQKLFFYD